MTHNILNVRIPANNFFLDGILQIPKNAHSIVLFVHGSGSNQYSVRNQYVANMLHNANIATLLFGLLSQAEDEIDQQTREYRFNIDLLSTRLIAVTDWVSQETTTKNLIMGYFGASTGGAAALQAAAERPDIIKAIVSRGGRPDLAKNALTSVKAPTLLIVGEYDEPVIEMNQNAMKEMNCIKKLEIIPSATHLFEEPGALDKVTELAKEWFIQYLT